jgi:hypothetical protein
MSLSKNTKEMSGCCFGTILKRSGNTKNREMINMLITITEAYITTLFLFFIIIGIIIHFSDE